MTRLLFLTKKLFVLALVLGISAPSIASIEKTEPLGDHVIGIWLKDLHHKVVLAEFEDYLVLIEAQGDETIAQEIHNYAKKHYPNKPIRYLFHSHHHGHSIGEALNYWVKQGTKVITSTYAKPTIEAKLDPALKADLQLTVATEKFELKDSFNHLTAFTLSKKTHGIPFQEYMVFHFPKQQLLAQGCLFNQEQGKSPLLTSRIQSLHQFIKDEGLVVSTCLPTNTTASSGHIDLPTFQELDQLVVREKEALAFAQKALALGMKGTAHLEESSLTAEAKTAVTQSEYLNRVALQLLNAGYYNEAASTFRINAQLFPETQAMGDVMLAIAGLDVKNSEQKLEEFFNQCFQCMPNSSYLNSFGYQLLKLDHAQKALMAFRLNTMLFPEETNSWDSYAEGLLANQQFEKAAFYYQKVKQMEPNGSLADNAKQKLALLNRLLTPKEINQELVAKDARVHLIGKLNKEAFSIAPYTAWFEKGYESYQTNETLVQSLQQEQNRQIEIKAFFGSWCGDSKRELPRFIKMAEAAGFSEDQLSVYAVNNELDAYKQSNLREEKDLNVFRVPTFIVFEDGKEIGRIIESPKESLEADLSKILSDAAYTPKYNGAMALETLLTEKGAKYIRKHPQQVAELLRGKTDTASEIYSYALTKSANKQYDLAISLFEINNILYPNYVGNPLRLGQLYAKLGKTEQAIPLLENYLEKRPTNTAIRVLIWELKQQKS